MATCSYCGDTFGNAGAAKSHEPHCAENPSNHPEQHVQHVQQEEPLPATQPQDGDALGVVEEAGGQLAQLRNSTPEEKAQAEGQLWQMAGRFLSGYGRQHVNEKLDGIKRAKNNPGEVQAVQEYPTCAECDGQLTHLPPSGTEFMCPWCGVRLET